MKIAAAFLIAAVAAPLPAFAQTPTAAVATLDNGAKPLDPATEAAARDLFVAGNVRAMTHDSMARSIDQMRTGAALSVFIDQNPQMRMKRAANPQAWDAALARLGAKQAAAMEKIFAEMEPEIETLTVRLYAENFTAADLKGMAAFYRTPLGQRMIAKLPSVMGQTMAWVQTEMPRRLGPAMAELQPEIQRELAPLMSTPDQAGGRK